jgi:hypothetical protein
MEVIRHCNSISVITEVYAHASCRAARFTAASANCSFSRDNWSFLCLHCPRCLNIRSTFGIFTFPFTSFYYTIGGDPLEYADSEKDLGVLINPSFDFNDQIDALISKGNQQLGLLRRTCHFVQDIKRRRALYLTLVWSQFEHCSPIWRPSGRTNLENSIVFRRSVSSGFYLKKSTHITHSPATSGNVVKLTFFPLVSGLT